jgi:TAT (twin-arginine translocation) pathway-exported protein
MDNGIRLGSTAQALNVNRRSFFKVLAAGAAVAAVPSLAFPKPPAAVPIALMEESLTYSMGHMAWVVRYIARDDEDGTVWEYLRLAEPDDEGDFPEGLLPFFRDDAAWAFQKALGEKRRFSLAPQHQPTQFLPTSVHPFPQLDLSPGNVTSV